MSLLACLRKSTDWILSAIENSINTVATSDLRPIQTCSWTSLGTFSSVRLSSSEEVKAQNSQGETILAHALTFKAENAEMVNLMINGHLSLFFFTQIMF